MILERGNAALGIRIEVEFDELAVYPNVWSCRSCGSLVYDLGRHADFHYAIATRIGDGPAPGFKPL